MFTNLNIKARILMNWLHEPGIRSLIDIKPDDLRLITKVHIVEESQIPHAIV